MAHELDYEVDDEAIETIVGDQAKMLRDPATPWGGSISERTSSSIHNDEGAVVLADFVVLLVSSISGTGKEERFRKQIGGQVNADSDAN